MSVTPGSEATAASYNILRLLVNSWFTDGCPVCVFGSPLQTLGWGGTIIPSVGSLMTAAQMNHLVDRCNLASGMLDSTGLVTLSQIVAGSPPLASDYNQIEGLATSILPLRFLVDPSEMSLISGITDSRTTPWGTSYPGDTTSINNIIRYDFSDFDEARYFFNSGGAVSMSFSGIGGTTPNYDNWIALFGTSVGTITVDYNSTSQSGSGGTVTVGTGYYGLTTSWQQLFQQHSLGGYSYGLFQEITINARRSASGDYIEFQTILDDSAPGSVDGTITGTYNYRKLDNQTSGAVSLSITAPVVTVQDTFE